MSSPCAGVHRYTCGARSVSASVFPVRGGSPSARYRRTDGDAVSSPCAGVHHEAARPRLRRRCLPRARGFTEVDGRGESCDVSSPCAGVHRIESAGCCPHTRVFPVRAGSPPYGTLVASATSVFPVRGGSPSQSPQTDRQRVSSPCAGVHRRAADLACEERVSSPCAGVHRQTRPWCNPATCLPRARGFTGTTPACCGPQRVFPVRGGSPPYGDAARLPTCLPRARGFTVIACRRGRRCGRVFPVRGGSPVAATVSQESVSSPCAGVHPTGRATSRESVFPVRGGSPRVWVLGNKAW